jgi:hypothetical protein
MEKKQERTTVLCNYYFSIEFVSLPEEQRKIQNNMRRRDDVALNEEKGFDLWLKETWFWSTTVT